VLDRALARRAMHASLALVLLAGSVRAQEQRTPATPVAPATQSEGDTAQFLRPGDVVRLKIWREPDLSGDFAVDERGIAVLPRLGPTHVTDQSPAALRASLISAYEQFLAQPSIEIILLRRVKVMGAVKNPGLYLTDPTMSIGDALALAGGTTSDANLKKLRLIRDGREVPLHVTSTTRLSDSPVRSGDQLDVPERSWLSKNGYFVGGILSAAVTIIAIRTSRK
jgi:protein involved in polysaccharide export with SLBB domain